MAPVKLDSRKKATIKKSLVVTLRCNSKSLAAILGLALSDDEPLVAEPQDAPEAPQSHPTPQIAATVNGDVGTDSGAATPGGTVTPLSNLMGPPSEGPNKKGGKRILASLNASSILSDPKPRKTVKKKRKLDDGGESGVTTSKPGGSGQRLGPRANQGAINAGLRALDRGGKPCRKWAKSSFTLKSFTGLIWDIPRWTAPPKIAIVSATEGSGASGSTSSKENNKDDIKAESIAEDASNHSISGDMEMSGMPSFNGSSPTPIPIASAS